VPRRDVFLWAAAILLLNQLFAVVKEISAASLELLVSDLLAVGIFQFLAWYVVFRLLAQSSLLPGARPRDILVTAVLCLPIFLPASKMIWIAATGVAVYLWVSSKDDAKLRAAAVVLATLAVQELWGHVLFDFVAFRLLRVEAAVVGTILEVARPGTMWHDNVVAVPGGWAVVIGGACSSFHNLSLAMLCWVTVSSLKRQDWRVRDFVVGAAIGLTMILFNVVRLCLTAWSFDLYHYWHDGTGADIFGVGASLTVLLLSLHGARPAGRTA
jgi:exosortase/archaeosortase family protein